MPNDDSSSQPGVTSEQLFQLRSALESLTQRYVANLLSAHEDVADQARWLTAILEAVGDGLIVFDKNLEVVLANRAALAIAGWDFGHLSRAEYRQKYDFRTEADGPRLSDDQEPIVVAMREKRTVEMEGVLTGYRLPPDGVWVRVHAAPVLSQAGDLLGGVSVFQDITERKQLRKQRDTLATLITHDIKNHLASEQVFLDLLQQEYTGKLGSDETEILKELRTSNQRFFEIARTLLEIFRTELLGADFSPTAVDLKEVLRSAVDLNSHAASLAGVQLVLSVDEKLPAIYVLESAIRQVFHNLVQNAVSASASGQEIRVSARKSDFGALVEVVDHGVGMTPEKVAQLFQAAKLDRLPASTTSTNFGLYLCRVLVEDQGGRIWCKSAPGEGSTLFVDLPLAR